MVPALPQILKLYGLTAVVFFAVDLVWLGAVAAGFYQKHLGAGFGLGRWLGVP